MNWIDNNSVALLQKGLECTWEKQRVISDNVANKSTPGYKAKYIEFEDELQSSIKKMKSTKDGLKPMEFKAELGRLNPKIKQNNAESTRLDGNNVNLDVEQMELARTQIQYEYLIRQVSDQFTRLRTVIDGR
ncbi:MAG: flagellar basal body rod protein FlgB [Oscillospiraceae bacterium]